MSDETGIEGTTADSCGAPTAGVTDCAEALRELEIFLDGELTDAQRDAVRAHLDGCMDCLGAFDFHAELKQVIAAKCQNDELPPDLVQRIEQCFGADLDGDGQIG
jgi:anti-sigma factor (TIGR02949 family)